MKILILFRGLPGSGKSTLSAHLCDVTLSGDDYFIQPDGSYQYDHSRIQDAHAQCQSNTETAMRLSIERIGVANTFTEEWEMQPYFSMAKKYGYQISTLIVENRHSSGSSHGVPESTIDAMASRFEIQLTSLDQQHWIKYLDSTFQDFETFTGTKKECLQTLEHLSGWCWNEYCQGTGTGNAVADYQVTSSFCKDWSVYGY